MVAEQHRRLAIAPLGPARQPWEHLAHSGDEVLALDQVEGVLEVDLEQSELRVLALADDIAEGVGDDFHSSLAAHSKVAAFEVLADLFSGHAEARRGARRSICLQGAEEDRRTPGGVSRSRSSGGISGSGWNPPWRFPLLNRSNC